MSEISDVEDAHPAVEGVVQNLPIGVAWVLQRLRGLEPDGVRRNQPEHHRPVLLDPGVAGDSNGVGGKNCLATACGQAQADIGGVRQSVEGTVGSTVTPNPSSLLGSCTIVS